MGIFWMVIILGGNFPDGNCPGRSYPGCEFSGGNCLGESYPGWEFSGWELSWWELSCMGIFLIECSESRSSVSY